MRAQSAEIRSRDRARAAHGRHRRRAARLAQGLGWLSIGLGAAEFFAPHMLTRYLGIEGRETLVRMAGLRGMATGAGLLSADDKAPWLWSRLGGDALDLAALSLGMDKDNPRRDNAILAAVMVGGVTALDFYSAQRLDGGGSEHSSRSGFPNGVDLRPRFVEAGASI